MQPSLQRLQQYASEMWDVFITGDSDLMTSNCSCCEGKRALVRRMLGVTGQDVAGASKVHKHPATMAAQKTTQPDIDPLRDGPGGVYGKGK